MQIYQSKLKSLAKKSSKYSTKIYKMLNRIKIIVSYITAVD